MVSAVGRANLAGVGLSCFISPPQDTGGDETPDPLVANDMSLGAPSPGPATVTQKHILASSALVASGPIVSSPDLSFVGGTPILDLGGAGGNYADFFVVDAIPTPVSSGSTINGVTSVTQCAVTLAGFMDGNSEFVTIGATSYPAATNDTGTATAGGTTFAVNFTGGVFTITRSGGGTIPIADMEVLIDSITIESTAFPYSVGDRTLSFVLTSGAATSAAKVATIAVLIAELPTEYTLPSYDLPSGTAHFPNSSSELTTVLTGGDIGTGVLAAGDIIVLDPAVTYTGSWDIPNLSPGPDVWTYMVTKAEYDNEGTLSTGHIRNIDYQHMATVQTIAQSTRAPAIGLDFACTRWRFVGIRFVSNDSSNTTQYGIVVSGYDGANTSTGLTLESQLPREIVFDRCEIKGRDRLSCADFDGLNWNGKDMAFIGGRIIGIQDGVSGGETHAIQSWFGGTRYVLQDTLIESAGIGVIYGGTGGTLGVPSSDIVIRGCHFRKTSKWITNGDGHNRALKNLFELKSAERVLITGNLFEDCSYDSQFGDALVFTPRNQNGGVPEAAIRDVTVEYNVFRRVEHPIRIASQDDLYDSDPSERIDFRNNLAYDLGYHSGFGRHMRHTTANRTAARGKYWVFEHNTSVLGPIGDWASSVVWLEGNDDGTDYSQWRANMWEGNGGGTFAGTGTSGITSTLNKFHITWAFTNNVVFDSGDAGAPAGNYNTAGVTKASIEFSDYTNRDYSLQATSPYYAGNASDAYDGLSMGADIAAVNTALTDVEHTEPLLLYLGGGTTEDETLAWVVSDGLTTIMPSAVVTYTEANVAEFHITVSGVLDGDDEQLSIVGNLFSLETDDTATGTIGLTTFAVDYDATTGVFTITKDGGGEMPVTDLQSLIRNIEYDNAAAPVTTGDRVLTCIAIDGVNASLQATATVSADDDGLTDARINFRSTSGYVTDDASETYSISGDTYPVTRGGITFGWDSSSTIQYRNRTTGQDRRLAGTCYIDNSTRYFMVNLNPGVYDVHVACGDFLTGLSISFEIRDESGNVLLSHSGTPAANSFLDGTGTARTAANWPSQNVAGQITVPTSSPQRVRIYRKSGATYLMLAHIAFVAPP